MRRLAKPVRQSMLRRALHEALQAVPFHEMSSAPAMLAPENEPVLDHLSVLLVEDNMVNRTLALEMLQRLGCDAMHAGNGVEALDALEKQEFDVVLMDCQMPVMDGFIATRKLREREVARKLEPTRVVALTANALAGDREACLAAGMNDYLAKPFTLAQLRNILLPSKVSRSAANKVTLDHSAIEAVRQLDPDGQDRLLSRLIALYRDDSSQLLADMDNGMKVGDAEAVARAAHTLKSSSANLGATNVAAIARQIETCRAQRRHHRAAGVDDQAARAAHRRVVRARSARQLRQGRLTCRHHPAEPIHVLIVDDDAGSRLLMRRALERIGLRRSRKPPTASAAVAAVESRRMQRRAHGRRNAVDERLRRLQGDSRAPGRRAPADHDGDGPRRRGLDQPVLPGRRDGLPRQAHQLEPARPSRAVPGARRPPRAGARRKRRPAARDARRPARPAARGRRATIASSTGSAPPTTIPSSPAA